MDDLLRFKILISTICDLWCKCEQSVAVEITRRVL